MASGILVRVVSPFMVAGDIAHRHETVEVTVGEARDLIARGVAVLADPQADGPRVFPYAGLSCGASMTRDKGASTRRRPRVR